MIKDIQNSYKYTIQKTHIFFLKMNDFVFLILKLYMETIHLISDTCTTYILLKNKLYIPIYINIYSLNI